MGKHCSRYVKANLPLLDRTSKASVWTVLGLGIAMCVVGVIMTIIAGLLAYRLYVTSPDRGASR